MFVKSLRQTSASLNDASTKSDVQVRNLHTRTQEGSKKRKHWTQRNIRNPQSISTTATLPHSKLMKKGAGSADVGAQNFLCVWFPTWKEVKMLRGDLWM